MAKQGQGSPLMTQDAPHMMQKMHELRERGDRRKGGREEWKGNGGRRDRERTWAGERGREEW